MEKKVPINLYDYKTTVVRNKKARIATSAYVTAAQRKELLTRLDDACLIVFSYYMEKSTIDGFNFDDERVAKALGYTIRKVQRARLKLTRNGWFLQATYTNRHTNRKVIMTYLGKGAVHEYRRNGRVIYITSTE